MENRLNLKNTEPKAYEAMYALEKYIQASFLSKTHLELIKIRASQLNGCAYCIDKHTRDALLAGETAQRIFLLNAWRETDLFTEEERVILAITEEITLIHHQGLTDQTYHQALKLFSQNYLAQVIMAVITINAWNRIGVSTRMGVEVG